jgi:hypothetical protein
MDPDAKLEDITECSERTMDTYPAVLPVNQSLLVDKVASASAFGGGSGGGGDDQSSCVSTSDESLSLEDCIPREVGAWFENSFATNETSASRDCQCCGTAEEPQDDGDDPGLSWRLNPTESMSDWTIVVRHAETDQVDLYHVHKNILAVGPRKSEFLKAEFTQQSNSNTQLTLPSVAARAFPAFLDFCYSPTGSLKITVTNATGLRHLSSTLAAKALHKRVLKFFMKTMSLKTVTQYYKDVVMVGDLAILRNLANFLAKYILKIDSIEVLLICTPTFWSYVLTSVELDNDKKQSKASLLLASYIQMHPNLTASDYRLLLLDNKNTLKNIHYDAAMTYLQLSAQMPPDNKAALETICIQQLVANWQVCENVDLETCTKLSPNVLAQLYLHTLEQARQDQANLPSPPSSSPAAAAVPPAPLESIQEEEEQEENDQVATLKREYEATIQEYKSKWEEERRQLHLTLKQLGNVRTISKCLSD